MLPCILGRGVSQTRQMLRRLSVILKNEALEEKSNIKKNIIQTSEFSLTAGNSAVGIFILHIFIGTYTNWLGISILIHIVVKVIILNKEHIFY